MSFNKAHQMNSKKSEGKDGIQDNENWQRSEQKEESTCSPRDDCSGSKYTSGSSRRSQNLSSKRKASTQDCVVRIYRTSDNVPSFKSKEVPRLFRNTASDKIQDTFKRAVAPSRVRKPDVTVKKPRLDYPTEADCCHPWIFDEDQCTNRSDYAASDKKDCIDNSLVECFDVESAEIVGVQNYENSCNILGDNFNENIVKEDVKEAKKIEFKRDLSTEDVRVEEDSYGSNIKKDDEIDSPHSHVEGSEKINKVQAKLQQRTLRRERQPKSNPKIVNTDFISPFSSTIHSCSGKRALSIPSVNDADGLTPANEQLEDTKAKSLIKLLETCPEGVDLKLSLFISACAHDPRTLQPFPERVFEDNDINRHLLYYIAEEIPSVSMISFFLKEKEPVPIRKELIPVVDWLIRCEDPRLELLKEQEKKELLIKISDVPTDTLPAKIFRLKTKRNSEIEQFWRRVKGDNKTVFAYHNCKVEQAHSLLYYGLDNHLTKGGVYGPGVYLTDDLSACLDNCKPGSTWGKSSLGTKLKIVFITEFVSNHSVLSYAGHGIPFRSETTKSETTTNSNYYFIKKPKLIRLRYLMVYVIEPSVLPKNPFCYVPIRKKLIKYLGVFRLSLLIATIFMGATASHRKVQPTTWFVETVQNYYKKFSTDLLQWPIWNYIETPYVAIPLIDSIPQTGSHFV